MDKLSNRTIATRLFEAVFDFNQNMWNTCRDLTLRPTNVINEYLLDKQDSQYLNPFRYAFITFTVSIVLAHWLGVDGLSEIEAKDEAAKQLITDAVALANSAMSIFMFLTLIPAAWVMKKLFNDDAWDRNNCYVLALYTTAYISLLQVLVILPLSYFMKNQYITLFTVPLFSL